MLNTQRPSQRGCDWYGLKSTFDRLRILTSVGTDLSPIQPLWYARDLNYLHLLR
jgi:hypothetical protein